MRVGGGGGIPAILEDSLATFEGWRGFLSYYRIVELLSDGERGIPVGFLLLLKVGGIPFILRDGLASVIMGGIPVILVENFEGIYLAWEDS